MRKIGVGPERKITVAKILIENHIDAALAMADFARNAQQTFVSLICDKRNNALGIIYHALGNSTDYSFNADISLEAMLSINKVGQVWFARNSPDNFTALSEKDLYYYQHLSANLLKHGISARGLVITTPSGNARFFDGMNEISFTYGLFNNGNHSLQVWHESFV